MLVLGGLVIRAITDRKLYVHGAEPRKGLGDEEVMVGWGLEMGLAKWL